MSVMYNRNCVESDPAYPSYAGGSCVSSTLANPDCFDETNRLKCGRLPKVSPDSVPFIVELAGHEFLKLGDFNRAVAIHQNH